MTLQSPRMMAGLGVERKIRSWGQETLVKGYKVTSRMVSGSSRERENDIVK